MIYISTLFEIMLSKVEVSSRITPQAKSSEDADSTDMVSVLFMIADAKVKTGANRLSKPCDKFGITVFPPVTIERAMVSPTATPIERIIPAIMPDLAQ